MAEINPFINQASSKTNTSNGGTIKKKFKILVEADEDPSLTPASGTRVLKALPVEMEFPEVRVENLRALVQVLRGSFHDINNGLTTLSYIGLAKNKLPVGHEAVKFLDKAEGAVKRLSEMVIKALEVSKGAKTQAVHSREINLKEFLSSFKLAYEPYFKGTGIDFQVEIPENIFYIDTDPVKLFSILENLVVNAKKEIFRQNSLDSMDPKKRLAKRFYVHLGFEIQAKEDADLLLFKVNNNGTKVPENLVDKVCKTNVTSTHNGEGIGLCFSATIAKKLLGGNLALTKNDDDEVEFQLSIDPDLDPGLI